MILVENTTGSVLLMVLGMILLGCWPVVWKHIGLRGRNFTHTFLDYCLSYAVIGAFTALTFGQLGPSVEGTPNFIDQLHQREAYVLVPTAAFGGLCFMLADICIQYSVSLVGLAIGPPILNAIAIIGSTTINYFLDNSLNKAELVFPGIASATVAIMCGALAHMAHPDSNNSSPHSSSSSTKHQQGDTQQQDVILAVDCASAPAQPPADQDTLNPKHQHQPLHKDATDAVDAAKASEQTLAAKHRLLGVGIAVAGGIVCCLVYPAINISSNDPFKWLPPGIPPLTVYATNFWFSIAFSLAAAALNITFLYKPPPGTPKSSIKAWLADNNCRGWSIFSAALTSFGDLAHFAGGEQAGYAASMMVSAYPFVGTLLGLLIYKEFRGASVRARVLLAGQFGFYMLAISLLAASSKKREGH